MKEHCSQREDELYVDKLSDYIGSIYTDQWTNLAFFTALVGGSEYL